MIWPKAAGFFEFDLKVIPFHNFVGANVVGTVGIVHKLQGEFDDWKLNIAKVNRKGSY